jgi:hypothetical protein
MFLREFLHLWTYELENGSLPISAIPDLMNAPGARLKREADDRRAQATRTDGVSGAPVATKLVTDETSDPLVDELRAKRGAFFCGFDARFIGDADRFGALPVDWFFPVGPDAPDTVMTGSRGLRFGEVIPEESLGELEDDVQGFDPDAPDGSQKGFLVIETDLESQRTEFRRTEDGFLYVEPVNNNAVLADIAKHAYLARGSLRPWAEPREGKVRWPTFVLACYMAMDRWDPDPEQSPLSTKISGMANFLGDLNEAPVPSRYQGWVFWMAFSYVQVGERTGFLDKISELHRKLMAKPHEETEFE